MELDAQQRTGKCARFNLECQKLRTRLTLILAPLLAKYNLDQLRAEKGKVSKAVAAKKKADKNADISAEQAQSKALDDQIKEQEQKTKDVVLQTE